LLNTTCSNPAASPGSHGGGPPGLPQVSAFPAKHAPGTTDEPVIRLFAFEKMPVGVVIGPDKEPLFDISNVARILGYHRNHCNGEFFRHICKGVTEMTLASAGGPNFYMVIPERDIYRLVLRANDPKAERFAEWLGGEVLPAIRKTGNDRFYSWVRQGHQVQCLLPRATALGEGADSPVACSGHGLSVHEAAQHYYKGLGVRGNTARNSLYRWLRGVGYLIPGTCAPFQQWVDAELFWSISQSTAGDPACTNDPKNHLASVSLITVRGFDRFWKEFKPADVPTVDEDRHQAFAYNRSTIF